MSDIKVLDCTLRDGGYCNNWNFGLHNIQSIMKSVDQAKIDIIECGYLASYNSEYESGSTRYKSLDQINGIIPHDIKNSMSVVMVNYAEYDFENIENYAGSGIAGIRIAFYKKDAKKALECCKIVAGKGYKVFVQPMLSISYTDVEFIELIKQCNKINPYAVYIVDSFGSMNQRDLIRLFSILDNNLSKDIHIGFHAHNNLQLAYSNAQTLLERGGDRRIIIDSSIMGMGRGAGNLNTELLIEAINSINRECYFLPPILRCIDSTINPFYMEQYWGYSLPNYLSAIHNVHPSYAIYLSEKNTLTVENMHDIFEMMDEDEKVSYNREYIDKLYIDYLARETTDEMNISIFKKRVCNAPVLIVGSGRSILSERKIIDKFVNDYHPIIISVNFDCPIWETDYIFISNLKRKEEISPQLYSKCIVTSNIDGNQFFLKVGYRALLNDEELVKDNAGLMLIKLLIELGVKRIYIAGMDGYSEKNNYAFDGMELIMKTRTWSRINNGICKVLDNYRCKVKINFLTKSLFEERN